MSKKKKKTSNLTLDDLQLKMLRAQQGVWHKKERVIIVFEGVDAAGKGGAIRRVTAKLDPRGVHVHPIGAPKPENQEKHFLYRFWTKLPEVGSIAIFDRSWYGRVLVEKVEELAPHSRLKEAYDEINNFEQLLKDDGIHIIKIFLTISKDEQLRRFEARLDDPYKRWKMTPEDIKAREQWKDYQKAFKEMFNKTSTKTAPWHIVNANDKSQARLEVLEIITDSLKEAELWIEEQALITKKCKMAEALADLENPKKKSGKSKKGSRKKSTASKK